MRRLLIAFLCALGLVAAFPRGAATSRSPGILVIVDSLATVEAEGGLWKTLGPFMDQLTRSTSPMGTRIAITNAPTMASPNSWTLAELVDSVRVGATNPKYDFDVILVLGWDDNNYLRYTSVPAAANNRALGQISKAANRPRVPVMWISTNQNLHNGSGDDSLGVFYNSDVAYFHDSNSAFVKSPAGFAFPADVAMVKRRTTGAGLYFTPVLSLAFYGYTSKADPDGVGGGGTGTVDSVCAGFYNPPIVSTRTGTANAAGYAWMNFPSYSSGQGSANYPPAALGLVAVGMLAKLAPQCFAFPFQHVALDIDDGAKRFTGQQNVTQLADAGAGYDSLGVWRIPFSLGIEVDSIAVSENGSTRFANEWTDIRRYGMGKVTVHCHRGTSAGGTTTDSTATSTTFTDIFGKDHCRFPFGTSSTQRTNSVYAQLTGATKKLVAYAGNPNLVTRHVMPPGDDYTTQLFGSVITGVMPMDSIAYAIALADAENGHGYRVVRSQFAAASASMQTPSGSYIGGVSWGTTWPLPNMATVAAGVGLTSTQVPTTRQLLFAPSRYLWGTTTDTTSTQLFGQMRLSLDNLLGSASGYARHMDLSTAQDGASEAARYTGTAKAVIWVTHIPNWRQGIGVTANGPYSGGRPAWENVRLVHGAMQAAKWAAMQANTSSTTYFRAGPMEWVYPDEITERDIR